MYTVLCIYMYHANNVQLMYTCSTYNYCIPCITHVRTHACQWDYLSLSLSLSLSFNCTLDYNRHTHTQSTESIAKG